MAAVGILDPCTGAASWTIDLEGAAEAGTDSQLEAARSQAAEQLIPAEPGGTFHLAQQLRIEHIPARFKKRGPAQKL